MAMQPLTLTSLDGGQCLDAAEDELAQLIQDVIDRPLVVGERTLTIKVQVKPNLNPEHNTNMPEFGWSVQPARPGRKGSGQRGVVHGGKLLVNSRLTPSDDPRQMTIEDVME